MRKKIQVVTTCHQCRYGEGEVECVDGVWMPWCYEESRPIPTMQSIPDFCRLKDVEEDKCE